MDAARTGYAIWQSSSLCGTPDCASANGSHFDHLLTPRDDARTLWLIRLRQPPGAVTARHIFTHLDRLAVIRAVDLPIALEHTVQKGARSGEKGAISSFPAWNMRSQHPERLDMRLIPSHHSGAPCDRTVYPVSLQTAPMLCSSPAYSGSHTG